MRRGGAASRPRSSSGPSSRTVTSGPSDPAEGGLIASSCAAEPARGLNSTHTFMGGSGGGCPPSPRATGSRAMRRSTQSASDGHLGTALPPCIMVGMPEFAHPEFLWLAPLAVLVAWWWARAAGRRCGTPTSGCSPGCRPAGRGGRSGAAPLLRGLACLALVFACAGPRQPDLRTRLPAEGIAIVLALDVSGSMGDRRRAVEPRQPAGLRGSKPPSGRSSCSSPAATPRTGRTSSRGRPTRSGWSRSPCCRKPRAR